MGWWDRFGPGATQPAPQRSYPGVQGPYGPPQATQSRSLPPDYSGPDMGIQAAVAAGGNYRPKAGKVASLKDTTRCPSCGSNNFFSRVGTGVINLSGQSVPPAPICAECGYNGRFTQTGTDLNSTSGANTGVPVKIARQDEMSIHGGLDYNHPMRVGG